ncbi:hypothetical protein, partial [Lutibaculum baratangense]|uniref:hypothetical protein n=1 Tax=Lutibaculum baratangense TaxID=1358440 RepID=UPI00058C706F
HPEHAFACTHLAALIKHGELTAFGRTAETLTAEALSGLYDTQLAIRIIDGWASCVPRLRSPAR